MEFNIIIEKGEEGYLISEVVELIANTREAISLYF
jgi:hypothetical protein